MSTSKTPLSTNELASRASSEGPQVLQPLKGTIYIYIYIYMCVCVYVCVCVHTHDSSPEPYTFKPKTPNQRAPSWDLRYTSNLSSSRTGLLKVQTF